MSQSHSPGDTHFSDARARFLERAASTAWELIPIADTSGTFLWVWYKPANVPQGLIVRIPDETFQNDSQPDHLTMRKLLQSAGVEPGCVSNWSLYGVAYEGLNGTSPYFDQPISETPPGADPNIVVSIDVQTSAAMQELTDHTGGTLLGGWEAIATESASELNTDELFDRMDSDWIKTLQVENQLTTMRKQLAGMLAKLKTMGRDLTTEERMFADRRDINEWQDARRWMRDACSRLSRYIREKDIGVTSSAGNRKWFEETYENFVVPRRPFEGLQRAQWEFEAYRKLYQTLLYNMNAAYSFAVTDGERRAQIILERIAAKVRSVQAKRRGRQL